MLNGLFLLNSAAAVAKDPYFPYVTLLLPGNGSNGAQNNTFLDSSTNNFTITRNGNTTQGSFSPYGSYWSGYFDGTGDYLSIADNAAFDFGSGDFTIEAWVNFSTSTSGADYPIVAQAANTFTSNASFLFGRHNSNKLRFIFTDDGTGSSGYKIVDSTNNFLPTAGVWYHLAVTRSGNTFRLFVDGTQVGSNTYSQSIYNGTRSITIGADDGASVALNGYISNVRVVKGTAVYTSAFTPSTTPLTAISGTSLLTCQSNRFRDNSSNAFAITVNGNTSVSRFSPFSPASAYSTTANGGSAYFDGSGDYLTSAASSAYAMGTGDFTIEGWYFISSSKDQALFDNRASLSSASGIGCRLINSTNTLRVILNNAALFTTSQAVTLNQWNHIAIVRASGTVTAYLNGTAMTGGSASGATNITDTNMWIGELQDTGYQYNGYISNFRVVKGTAVYTSAFTPPTAPVTAISGTSLLLNATNAAIFDNAMINDMETVGNAQVSTAQSKFGGSSMYFDGSGDWLTVRDNPALQFGTGNFTVEFWAYVSSSSGYRGVIGKGSSTTGWAVFIDTGGNWAFTNNTTNTIGSVAAAFNTWTHVAFVRSGTTATLYINGTSAGSATVSTNFNQTDQLVVGAGRDLTIPYTGYLDDVRLTAGVARYTSNFTPPTAAFPVQ